MGPHAASAAPLKGGKHGLLEMIAEMGSAEAGAKWRRMSPVESSDLRSLVARRRRLFFIVLKVIKVLVHVTNVGSKNSGIVAACMLSQLPNR